MESLSPQIKEKIEKLQSLQSALDSTILQKHRIQEELAESERAIEALKEYGSGKVYQYLGKIMIQKDAEIVLLELQERLELLKLRSSALQRQEEKLREKIKEIGESVRESLAEQ